ncbi:MAG: hypothetical protein J6L76_07045 [Clostridia bacterium]|nr:hypothetical protein [Clostridia bacterium]
MIAFSAKEVESLRNFLYKSAFHDACVCNVEFINLDHKSSNLHMTLCNKCVKVQIDVHFEDVAIVSSVEWEDDTTLVWFGVEDKDLALTNFLAEHDFKEEDKLYLGFQFLSLREMKLLCRKITIAETSLC